MNMINLLQARKLSLLLLGSFLLLGLAAPSYAVDEIYTSKFSNTAAGGYDVVSFFNSNEPLKGSKKFSLAYKGANWHFSNHENLSAFEREPEKYAPQYGGYCAYAIALNEVAKGSPKYWDIHEGKLYFSLNKKFQRIWSADKENLITMADMFWPDLVTQ